MDQINLESKSSKLPVVLSVIALIIAVIAVFFSAYNLVRNDYASLIYANQMEMVELEEKVNTVANFVEDLSDKVGLIEETPIAEAELKAVMDKPEVKAFLMHPFNATGLADGDLIKTVDEKYCARTDLLKNSNRPTMSATTCVEDAGGRLVSPTKADEAMCCSIGEAVGGIVKGDLYSLCCK
jgi:hypothetical protein